MSDPAERRPRPLRTTFPAFRVITTRWMDNDHYCHVNNVIYYSWFDTAVNGFLLESTGVDTRSLPAIGLVVESGCRYFSPLSFPDFVEIGLSVGRLGMRSISYELGVFLGGERQAVAAGEFVHVYVDRTTRTPTLIPEPIRAAVTPLIRKPD
jgi:acyl-CoA thioester hydrolase